METAQAGGGPKKDHQGPVYATPEGASVCFIITRHFCERNRICARILLIEGSAYGHGFM